MIDHQAHVRLIVVTPRTTDFAHWTGGVRHRKETLATESSLQLASAVFNWTPTTAVTLAALIYQIRCLTLRTHGLAIFKHDNSFGIHFMTFKIRMANENKLRESIKSEQEDLAIRLASMEIEHVRVSSNCLLQRDGC